MSRDLDTFIMDANHAMEEDPDDEIVAACCVLLLSGLSASAVLLAVAEEFKIKRSKWVKPYATLLCPSPKRGSKRPPPTVF